MRPGPLTALAAPHVPMWPPVGECAYMAPCVPPNPPQCACPPPQCACPRAGGELALASVAGALLAAAAAGARTGADGLRVGGQVGTGAGAALLSAGAWSTQRAHAGLAAEGIDVRGVWGLRPASVSTGSLRVGGWVGLAAAAAAAASLCAQSARSSAVCLGTSLLSLPPLHPQPPQQCAWPASGAPNLACLSPCHLPPQRSSAKHASQLLPPPPPPPGALFLSAGTHHMRLSQPLATWAAQWNAAHQPTYHSPSPPQAPLRAMAPPAASCPRTLPPPLPPHLPPPRGQQVGGQQCAWWDMSYVCSLLRL